MHKAKPSLPFHLKIAHAWKPLQKQEHCRLRQLPEQECSLLKQMVNLLTLIAEKLV